MIRAVLDANILVSAFIRPDGPPGQILNRLLRRRQFELVVSPSILDEVAHSLRYPKVRSYLSATDEELDLWVAAIAVVADTVDGDTPVDAVAEDPDDNKYVAAALEGRASWLVSGDRHLLSIEQFQGIRIITARQFLVLLGDS